MSKVVNYGVIGVGYIADEHVKGVLSVPQRARVYAVSDAIEERAKGGAKKWGAKKWCTDYRDLLKMKEIDAVDICVPHHLHAQMCIDATEAGKHILIEKPFTITVSEADNVVRAAEKAGIKLMVAHNQLFFPAVKRAKKLIEEGYLGKITLVNSTSIWLIPFKERGDWGWRLDLKKAGGGTLFDTGMHRWYLSRYFGGDLESVMAYTSNLYFKELFGMEGEDTALASIKYKSGAIGSVQVGLACYNPSPQQEWVEIYGIKGNVKVVTGYGMSHEMMLHGNELWLSSTKLPAETGGQLYKYYTPINSYEEEVRHFIDCIIEDKTPLVTGYDGKACVEMARAAYESVKTGKSVKLPFKD